MVDELFAGRSLRVGLVRCPASAAAWGQIRAAEGPAAVFPLTSFVVEANNGSSTLANPNHVLFFNAGDRFRRMPHDPRGEQSVVVETIYALDGMGRYFINALGAGDPYPIMAWLMVTSTMIIVANLAADVLLGYLDPRIRLQ